MKKENILRLLATLSPKEMESIFDRCTPEDRSFAFSVLNECIAKTESLIIQSEIDASNSSQMINLYLKRLWACVPEDMKSGLAPFFENYSTVCEEAAQK